MSEPNPYREEGNDGESSSTPPADSTRDTDFHREGRATPIEQSGGEAGGGGDGGSGSQAPDATTNQTGGSDQPYVQGGGGGQARGNFQGGGQRPDRPEGRNGRRHRRGRGRGPRRDQAGAPGAPAQAGQSQGPPQDRGPIAVVATSEARGWFDPSRDGGYIRRPGSSYLAEAGDAWVPPHVVRQYGLRKSDLLVAGVGTDPRGRSVVAEIRTIN
jgi:transcription termination factor Rho